jgi:hypothetical protein
VDVVGQAIEKRAGQSFRAEHRRLSTAERFQASVAE